MKITKLIIAAALGTTAIAGIGIAAAVTPHGMMHGGPHGWPHRGPMGGPMGARMFERTDANHDNRISRDEVRAQVDAHFATLDANHDGFVDKPEIAAHRQQLRAKFWAMHNDMPPPPPPPPSPPAATPNPVK